MAIVVAEERRQKLAELVNERGYIPLAELVDLMGVSESTVRRDLDSLHDAGIVRRTHGGAAGSIERVAGLTAFDERRQKQVNEKQQIGAAMAAIIQDGETVFLDGGTTTYEVARHLIHRSLLVFTNSLPIANLLSGCRGIDLVVVGGVVYPKTGVALGPMTTAALRDLHVQRLVLGVAGITRRGLFNGNLLLVETERAMMACAEETNVVADATKFGQPGLAFLAEWGDIHRVVTDESLSDEQRTLVAGNVDLVIAGAKSQAKAEVR
ncbi:MAG TPA: DeoR/GlpR family DNA-binding transcription regulator [Planctomycetia bacterium]|nr:DeoR/GlpR family DNA-binding transcription regulator [Planctomycetia bacterium]